MSTAISIRSLVKRFPPRTAADRSSARAAAVDSVSLDIAPGELFFLLGPSGCGKTTLLRMIAGFIEPTSGSILFNASDVTHLDPAKRNTGMVFQSYALWPHMSVADNVAFGLDVRRVPADEKARRVREALATVRMDHLAARRPNELSGGQQQRVALARALVVRPDVLLLDEPLSNLDARLRLELRSEIRRVCKSSGITTVYVTHDQKEALSMADRVAIMNAGRVVQLGSPADLYRRPESRFVAEFLGETNLLPGTVEPPGPSPGVAISTPFGRLHAEPRPSSTLSPAASSAPPGGGAGGPAADVLVSIRPESLRLDPGGSLRGAIVDRVYLGEIEQLIVELKPAAAPAGAQPPTLVRVNIMNPDPASDPHRCGRDGAAGDGHAGAPGAVRDAGRGADGEHVMLSVDPRDVVILRRD